MSKESKRQLDLSPVNIANANYVHIFSVVYSEMY